MALEELFDGGDPPADRLLKSEKKEHQPGPIHGSVEGLLEH
jgi:hypothetical protein